MSNVGKVDVNLTKTEWLELVNRMATSLFPEGSGARSIWDERMLEFKEGEIVISADTLTRGIGEATLNFFIETALKEGIALIEADKLKGKQNDLFGGDKASTDLESEG